MAKKAELKAVLSLDNSPFKRVLASSVALGKTFAKSLGSTAFGAITSAFNKLKYAIPLAGAALAAGTVRAYNFGSEMQDLHDRTGMAVEKLVVMKQALSDNGIEIDALVPAFAKMSKALVSGAEGGSAKAFEQIGLHVKDLMALDPADQFTKIGAAIQRLASPTAKLAAVTAIFGKSGGSLLSFFADPKAMETAAASVGKQAQILGKNAEVFDRISDRLGRVFTKIRGFFVGVAASLAPVMDKMTALFDKADLSAWGERLGNAIKKALAWMVAFWKEPGKVTGYFWEVVKAGALDFGNSLFNIMARAGEYFAKSIGENAFPLFDLLLGAAGGAGLAKAALGPKLAAMGKGPLGETDFLGAGAQRAKVAGMRPTDLFEQARRMIGDVAGEKKFADTTTPWRLRGFHGAGQLLGKGKFPSSSLMGASMGGYLEQRRIQLSDGMEGTGSLASMRQGAYDRSPILSETARRRIARASESEAQIRQRHALGNFAAGDTHRLKKIQMEAARKEAGQLTDNEALLETAKNTKRMADVLTEN